MANDLPTFPQRQMHIAAPMERMEENERQIEPRCQIGHDEVWHDGLDLSHVLKNT